MVELDVNIGWHRAEKVRVKGSSCSGDTFWDGQATLLDCSNRLRGVDLELGWGVRTRNWCFAVSVRLVSVPTTNMPNWTFSLFTP